MGKQTRRQRKKLVQQAGARVEAEATIEETDTGGVRSVVQSMSLSRSGPIPTAAELEAYSKIDPDLPMLIVGWAESEMDHRRGLDHMALAAEISSVNKGRGVVVLGQLLGFGLGLAAIIGGVVIAWKTGESLGGVSLSAFGLASLVWGPHALRSRSKPAEGDE